MRRRNIKLADQHQLAKYLSGGNQQKAVVGKWIALDLDILIMDEPTRGIDVGSKDEIYRITAGLAGAVNEIIYISSEVAKIVHVADRILALKNGEITAEYSRGVAQPEIIRKFQEGNQ